MASPGRQRAALAWAVVLGFVSALVPSPQAQLAASSRANAAPPPVLWFAQPSAKWDEALPIGSGRLGAMVFGGIVDERIQFNEDTLWTGHPRDYVRAGSGDVVPEVRALLAAGKTKEAEQLAKAKMLGDPSRQKAYQPFGDLRIHFNGLEPATDYRRELNLDTAVATTRFSSGDVVYTREVFASYPDQVIAVRLTASQPGKLNFSAKLDSPHTESISSAKDGNKEAPTGGPVISIAGQVEPDGLRFEARARILAHGGTVTIEGDTVVVTQANDVTLLLVAATSFKNYEDISADPAARCLAQLGQLGAGDFGALKTRHLADHQRLFRRVGFHLGPAGDSNPAPVDERVRRVRAAGNIEGDPTLPELAFNYGRYLLIASSRPGSQPANLQGVWNELLDPPWESKWTTNINVEMNYWLAEVTNLAECHEPLFDLVDDLAQSGARTAQSLYHSRGWVVHHNTDLWRGTAPINNIDGIWPTGGAWLCHHLWEHYVFSGDKEFLARRAYPAMKSAALFFVDTLAKEPKTGWLVTTPSYSPEQAGLTVGPTMDNQLIRALWHSTVEAAQILGVDRELQAQLNQLLPQLPPNQIGRHGQLQEWLDDIDKPNNAHRHLSPLWALYPGNDITPADPKVFAAAKTLLTWRGDGGTGWSYAWRIPLWARVRDGEFAYRQLSLLLAKRMLPNLFDLCGPFQIDGNFGVVAGMTELLLQSHERTPAPGNVTLVDLLPALPKAWASGSITGLRARDGFEVDLNWENGALTAATIRSQLGKPCRVRYGDQILNLSTTPGKTYFLGGHLETLSHSATTR